MYRKAPVLCDFILALFNFRIVEFFHPAALQAYQVVMVGTACQFEHGLAAFEMVSLEQTCLLELGQNAVYGSQPNILSFTDQRAVDIFRR
jgi:hypothetical protein